MSIKRIHVGPSGSLFYVAGSDINPCFSIQVVSHSGTTSTRDIRFYGSNAFDRLDNAKDSFVNSGSNLWKWDLLPEITMTGFSGSAATPANSGSRIVNLNTVACKYIGMRIRVDHSGVFDIIDEQKRSS